MKCPQCSFNNPENIKFCGECGNKLEKICPDCNSPNPPKFKFCGECGVDLQKPKESFNEQSFDDKIDKIQRYLPKGLTEKILSQKGKIEGERKQVTVMFCDMEGFTPLVGMIGAEDAYDIMDQVYEILIHKVHDFEGTINEMTGDGIMALFGAPIALEDAPQRAIRSAFSIHREIAKFSDKLIEGRKDIPSLKMRIGIHSGPVVVGTLGNNLRVEFKAVGDTVNFASRMEGLAEPGTSYVTSATFKLTEGLFRFEALGEKHIKGKETPVDVYRVIAPSTRKTRFDVNAERGLTTFVGRNREMELLLDSLGRTKEGAGQAFSIIGEAGIGKSRFLYEFRKAISNEDITFLEGKCLSYGKGTPYHPISDILKGNFEIMEKDTDEDIRIKVRQNLEILNADKSMTLPYLLELLSVNETGIDRSLISPEGLRDRTIESIKQIILKGAQKRPLILAIEDLHWVDKSTEDVLKQLIDTVPGVRVLMIFTYRPEFIHTWGGRSYHNQITLNRISNRESMFMVSNLLGAEPVDTELQRLILSRTEGVPFFIEEFVKSLLDLGLIKRVDDKILFQGVPQSINIPSTIQDMIMARVDKLPLGAKEILQIGSAIEREFGYNLIHPLSALGDRELLSNLSALKDSELLYERGIFPETTYIFKHALTREVIYDSILSNKKRIIHNKIGNVIETIYQNKSTDHYSALVEHFLQAENYEKAAEYSKIASKVAQKRSAYKDAIEYAKKCISSLEKLKSTDDLKRRIIDMRISLSDNCTTLNYHTEAQDAVAPIIDMAMKMEYKKSYPTIHLASGAYLGLVKEDLSSGAERLNKAIEISESSGDILHFWLASYFLASLLTSQCEFKKSNELYRKILELSESGKHLSGICAVKLTRAALNYNFQGKINDSYIDCKDSLSMSIELEDTHIIGMAYSCYGTGCFFKGFFKDAEKHLLEAVSLCERTNHFLWGAWASFWLGEIYYLYNDFEKSCFYFNNQIQLLKKSDMVPQWINLAKVSIAKAQSKSGIKNINMDTMNGFAATNQAKSLDSMLAHNLAEIYMNIGNIQEAEKWIVESKKINKENKMIFHLGQNFAIHAEICKQMDDKNRAKKHLLEARKRYKECGADGWKDQIEKELSLIQ
ncbi:AAA family ATPase [Thermodesulfobacteriota bacterium]